jgi:hypothetical protein
MPTKCSIHNCTKPSVSKGLCDTHRKRVARHGTPEQTRPADWGAKEKHPKYKTWCNLRRYHRDAIPKTWAVDFWSFVADVPDRPTGRCSAQRVDTDQPWSKDNFYWREPIVDDVRRSDHKAYMREYARRMRAANPDYHKSLKIKKMYGITIDTYNEMLTEQKGCCAICAKPESNEIKGKVTSLAIDHDHATGAIRALLCSNCNRGLGLFNDSVELLAKAHEYVLYHKPLG